MTFNGAELPSWSNTEIRFEVCSMEGFEHISTVNAGDLGGNKRVSGLYTKTKRMMLVK